MRKWLAKILLGKDYKILETPNRKKKELFKNKYQMIKEIIDNFNFDKVHYVMTELNWEWVQLEKEAYTFEDIENAPKRVPTIEELKMAAINRIECAIEEAEKKEHAKIDENYPFSSASGGFKTTVFKDKKGRISWIELQFVLTDWESAYDETDSE